MSVLLWDASAIAKRYASENGSATVNGLWALGAVRATPFWCYAEVYAILNRRLNAGRIDAGTFAVQTAALKLEVLSAAGFELLDIEKRTILAGIPLIRSHALNSADAAILAAFISYRTELSAHYSTFAVITSDQRLVRASTAEGFITINPELMEPGRAIAITTNR